MAFKATIEITDHNSAGVCTSFYAVSYEPVSGGGAVPLPNQFTSPVIVGGLESGIEYNITITRNCCNGLISSPVIVQVMDQLPAPANFTATFLSGTDWDITADEVTAATNYILEALSVTQEEVYNGPYVGLPGTHTTITPDTDIIQWRVKAQAAGYQDSEWATFDVT